MKAEELRIGNIVDTPIGIGSIVSIHDLKFNSVRVCSKYHTRYRFVDVDKLIPVPLTPEILEKIEGVVKDDKYESFYYLDHQLFSCKVYKNVGLPMEITADGVVRYACDKIKHLHTFQNVIYALTQTELQIKL